MRTRISPLAGKRLAPSRLVDVGKLVTAYYTGIPDPALPAQRVAFGTGAIARAMPVPRALRRGAHVIADAKSTKGVKDAPPSLSLLASGSEVGLIVGAAERLRAEGIAVRCVSMPSRDLFEAQPQRCRGEVLPPHVTARLAAPECSHRSANGAELA